MTTRNVIKVVLNVPCGKSASIKINIAPGILVVFFVGMQKYKCGNSKT